MMLVRTNNRDAQQFVQQKVEFTGHNLFALWHGDGDDRRYVVYSYRRSWPLYIYIELTGQWYENIDTFSVTTSVHRSQTYPMVDTIKLKRHEMDELGLRGYVVLAKQRVLGGL
jgi:hypothetical protein